MQGKPCVLFYLEILQFIDRIQVIRCEGLVASSTTSPGIFCGRFFVVGFFAASTAGSGRHAVIVGIVVTVGGLVHNSSARV